MQTLLAYLSDVQMADLHELVGLHYAKKIEERDDMMKNLVQGSENVKELMYLIATLDNLGAKVNLIDDE